MSSKFIKRYIWLTNWFNSYQNNISDENFGKIKLASFTKFIMMEQSKLVLFTKFFYLWN